LEAGGGSHAEQTSAMLVGIDQYLEKIQPDHVLIYGDTNSTLAGALAATKREIPLSHVEAGLRSFNRSMPEEINRVIADHVSNYLFCPTRIAVENLRAEGVTAGVHLVGDVMADALLIFAQIAEERSSILSDLSLESGSYALATAHRSGNVDDREKLATIIQGFGSVDQRIILPLHPRTKKMLQQFDLSFTENVITIEPVGYLDMLMLEKNADCILTDSGGIQKEAYLLGVRCITLREETEWVETVEAGWNILAGVNAAKISQLFKEFHPADKRLQVYGGGDAADKIVQVLKSS
jgi:UDP-GlcNAc3NAcA epimerase